MLGKPKQIINLPKIRWKRAKLGLAARLEEQEPARLGLAAGGRHGSARYRSCAREARTRARLGYAERLCGSGSGSKARVSCSGRKRGTTAAGGAARVAKGDATSERRRRRGAWQEFVERGGAATGRVNGRGWLRVRATAEMRFGLSTAEDSATWDAAACGSLMAGERGYGLLDSMRRRRMDEEARLGTAAGLPHELAEIRRR